MTYKPATTLLTYLRW